MLGIEAKIVKNHYCFQHALLYIAGSDVLGLGNVKTITFRHSAPIQQIFSVLSNQATNFTWGQGQ